MTNPKEQNRLRKRDYRARTRTFSLSVPKSEAAVWDTLAIGKGCTNTPTFLKAVVRAHVAGNGYIIPNDGQLLRLERQLRSVGSTVNQVVRHVHISQGLTYRDLHLLQRHLAKMEVALQEALTQPSAVEAVLTDYFNRYPDHHQQVIDYIKTLSHDYQN